jgi:dipeptidyl aminopeptidase/acylaminoacyl peptidase
VTETESQVILRRSPPWFDGKTAGVFNLIRIISTMSEATTTENLSPPIIPRELLFGNPERSSPQISPDGSKFSFIAPDESDVLQVWVLPNGAPLAEAKQVTKDKKRGIRGYAWSENSGYVLYMQDSDGDENWHVFSTDLETNLTRDLTPFLGCQASILATHEDYPTELLVSANVRDATLHEVYRVNLETGAMVLDTENPGGIVGWLPDNDFKVRGGQRATDDGGFDILVRDTVDTEWRSLLKVSQEDADTGMVGFNKTGDDLFLLSCVGSNTLRLVKKNLASGAEECLSAFEDSDVQSLLFDKETKEPLLVTYGRARLEWQALDQSVGADWELVRALHHGDPQIVGRSRDDKTWLVAVTTDSGPIPYYKFDRESKEGTLLFTSRPKLEGLTFAPMRAIEIQSRDGLSLPSYLTVPVGSDGQKLPLILNVHGGPWVRDHWGYHPEAQWMANRGYAVLQVNYRGSTGFGKKFLHAGDREWAAKMHDDLLDAMQWAIDEGIADPDKVAIYGGSYGGYAALVGATFTPDVFCCAVDIVGPSNLETLLSSFPPYWEPLRKMFETRVGPADDPEFLKSRSPLYKADQIRIPLLIAQGANDPRVKQAEAEQIVEAARKNGKDVQYMLFEDEGHGFARPENRMAFYAAAEKFLSKHLGGRLEDTQESLES